MMSNIRVEDIRFTPFTDGKIRVWFKMIDVGKDGHMCKDDFLAIADRFVKEYSLNGEKASEIRDWLADGWNIVLDMEKQQETMEEILAKMPLVVAMSNTLRSGSKVSEDDFAAAYGQLISVYPALAKDSLEKMVTAFFEVFDNDSDNYISEQEMTSAMRCFGYDHPDLVKRAFVCMDQDKDGRLSRQEYVGGWVSFMLGQDMENPFVKVFAPHLLQK